MPPPWTAERSVPPELARDLVEHRFPALAPVRVGPASEGWDNVAYLINDVYVFRFPRRSIAVGLLRTEVTVLPVIAPRLPLGVPVPLFIGEPEERFPWPFAGYRRIAGRTACRADLDDAQRGRAAVPLGRFLRALHSIPLEEAERAGAGPDTLARMDIEKRRGMIAERLDELQAKGLLDDVRPWRELAAIDEETWRKARFRALFHAVMLLLYGADIGDADLIREARTALRNVLV